MPWKDLQCVHARHVKALPNGDQRTFAHSNLIEGFWAELKYHIRHIYYILPGREDTFVDFVFEAVFRRNC